ncbi:altronate dehydratase [Paraburkholderia sp. GAS32]|jgi:altronate hydrolase
MRAIRDRCRGEIFQLMLATASGQAKSGIHGYGQNEFVPWQIGAIT